MNCSREYPGIASASAKGYRRYSIEGAMTACLRAFFACTAESFKYS